MIEGQEDDVGSSDASSTSDNSLTDKKTLERLREENQILQTRLGKLEQEVVILRQLMGKVSTSESGPMR